jgi:hypothetical protein
MIMEQPTDLTKVTCLGSRQELFIVVFKSNSTFLTKWVLVGDKDSISLTVLFSLF